MIQYLIYSIGGAADIKSLSGEILVGSFFNAKKQDNFKITLDNSWYHGIMVLRQGGGNL